jgi:hypothetical protein
MVDVPSVPMPPAPSPVAAPAARPGLSGPAILSLLLGIIATIALLTVRTLAASVNEADFDRSVLGTALGVFGVGSIVLIVAIIVLGHVGARKGVHRGRVIAGVGLGLGYFHLALWLNRMLLATIEVIATGKPGDWLFWVFDWS